MRRAVVFCSSFNYSDFILKKSINTDEVIFVSDNYFYSTQIDHLASLSPVYQFRTWKDFMSDQEMEIIDLKIIDDLKQIPKEDYYSKYILLQKETKTKFIIQKLKRSLGVASFYFHRTNIGFDIRVFEKEKFIEIKGKSILHDIFYSLPHRKLKNIFFKKNSVLEIRYINLLVYSRYGNNYLLIGGFKRLQDNHCRVIYNTDVIESRLAQEIELILNEFEIKNIGVEIHQFDANIAKLSQNIVLIFDGFMPPNYTESYHQMYPVNFCYSGYLKSQKDFCLNNGLKFDAVFSNLRPKVFSNSEIKGGTNNGQLPDELKTIVLLLQCSSEWTSLVNRSDSVSLVNFIVNLAQNQSDTNFVIRPHPGMPHPMHDGPNSITELKKVISEVKLDNLTISERSLQEDIQLGDLFITDFSTTIFDVMSKNKIWISVNLSNRRNFLEYFGQYGFIILNDEKEAESCINQIKIEYRKSKLHFLNSVEKYFENDTFY